MSSLASKLPDVLLKSKAFNTGKCYQRTFKLWSIWASRHNLISLPAKDIDFSLYLVSLIQSNKSSSTVDETFYGVKWAHELAGFSNSNPCGSFVVKSVREAAHRILGHSVSKKEPITSDILNQMVSRYLGHNSNTMNLRNVAMCLIAYAGFLRFSELSNIKRSDLVFHEDFLSIFIETSKTDIYREGKSCLIAKTGLITCPVTVLEKYLKCVNLYEDDSSEDFIFRSVLYLKSRNEYNLKGSKPLSYTRTREVLLEMLKDLGLDKTKFGLHSLRSGGCTAAANFGIPDRLFKRHGRWRSEKAKDGYVKDSIENLLSVSRSLGV